MDLDNEDTLRHNVAVKRITELQSEKLGRGIRIDVHDTSIPILNEGITQIFSLNDLAVYEIYHDDSNEEYQIYAYPRDSLDDYNDRAGTRSGERR